MLGEESRIIRNILVEYPHTKIKITLDLFAFGQWDENDIVTLRVNHPNTKIDITKEWNDDETY